MTTGIMIPLTQIGILGDLTLIPVMPKW